MAIAYQPKSREYDELLKEQVRQYEGYGKSQLEGHRETRKGLQDLTGSLVDMMVIPAQMKYKGRVADQKAALEGRKVKVEEERAGSEKIFREAQLKRLDDSQRAAELRFEKEKLRFEEGEAAADRRLEETLQARKDALELSKQQHIEKLELLNDQQEKDLAIEEQQTSRLKAIEKQALKRQDLGAWQTKVEVARSIRDDAKKAAEARQYPTHKTSVAANDAYLKELRTYHTTYAKLQNANLLTPANLVKQFPNLFKESEWNAEDLKKVGAVESMEPMKLHEWLLHNGHYDPDAPLFDETRYAELLKSVLMEHPLMSDEYKGSVNAIFSLKGSSDEAPILTEETELPKMEEIIQLAGDNEENKGSNTNETIKDTEFDNLVTEILAEDQTGDGKVWAQDVYETAKSQGYIGTFDEFKKDLSLYKTKGDDPDFYTDSNLPEKIPQFWKKEGGVMGEDTPIEYTGLKPKIDPNEPIPSDDASESEKKTWLDKIGMNPRSPYYNLFSKGAEGWRKLTDYLKEGGRGEGRLVGRTWVPAK